MPDVPICGQTCGFSTASVVSCANRKSGKDGPIDEKRATVPSGGWPNPRAANPRIDDNTSEWTCGRGFEGSLY